MQWLKLLILAIVTTACEQEFSEVGSEILADPNYTTSVETFSVKTYNEPISSIQSNILNDKLFGYSQDAFFGNFKSNVVTQLTPATLDPFFGDNIELDSVVLTIPYFSSIIEIDDDNNNIYELDSIYGSEPIQLKIYRNNYFLRSFNPSDDLNVPERYFTDRTSASGEDIMASDLENTLLYQDDSFSFSSDPIILTEQEFDEDGEPILDDDGELVFTETGRTAPALRVRLDSNVENGPDPVIPDNFWEELIIEKEGGIELSNENNFQDYFRGIYLSAEPTSAGGSMVLLNLGSTNANITLYYTSETEEADDDINDDTETTIEQGTFVMNFSGNRVNFIENELNPIPPGNTVDGDSQLFLKGAQGNLAVIELFGEDGDGNEVADELDQLREENWLINEARLTFYVDQSIAQQQEPDRVFIMDLDNNIFLKDWEADQSAGLTAALAKTDHLPPLVRENDEFDGQGIKYKVEVTEHIKNLIVLDSTNTKLGLFVTSNTLSVENVALKDEDGTVQNISSGTAVTPRGTILHGNLSPIQALRPKLEIFYTEPENN